MENLKFCLAVVLFFFCTAVFAQVQIDHQLQMTGTGSNAAITGIEQVPDSGSAVNVKSIQNGSLIYAASTGSSDSFAINITPAIIAYKAGMVVNFISNQNVTGPATLNVNGLGDKFIKKNINQDLGSCDLQSGQIVTVVYDGINFQMTSVSVAAYPTTANAGPTQSVTGTSTTLAGNTPVTGTGLWTIISGTGGSLSNTASPSSTFTGLGGNTYILKWTISTACLSSSSIDTISFGNTPSSIPNLYLWYDAADASTFTYSSGNSVSVWADKSGNGFDASQANTSYQPTVIAHGINGLPAVRFTSSTDAYLVNSVFTMNLANRSIFVVVKDNDANVQYSGVLSISGSSRDLDSDNGYNMGNYSNGEFDIVNNVSAPYIILMPTSSSTSWQLPLGIYTDIASSGAGTGYVNGVPNGTANNPSASTSPGGLAIGARYLGEATPRLGTNQLDGDYAELIIYNRALTTQERDQVGAYLSAKWGIPFAP